MANKYIDLETDYTQVSYRTLPFAYTVSDGKVFMVRDNYNLGWDTSGLARFSSLPAEESMLEAEVVCERAGPNACVVVRDGYVYFTASEWNSDGTSVWRLPVGFTNKDKPEEFFNLPTNYPELNDCRGIAFDEGGALYLTCGVSNVFLREERCYEGKLIKIVNSTPEILASLSDPKAVICIDGTLSVESVVAGEKGVVSLSSTKEVSPELTFTKDVSVKEMEQQVLAEKLVDLGAGKIGR